MKPPRKKRQPKGDYSVGYCRPPKGGQFPPGKSGNPKGRTKGSQNTKTLARAILNRRFTMTVDERPKKISVREGILLQMADSALKRDFRASVFLLAFDDEGDTRTASFDPAFDRELLAGFLQRQTGKLK